MCWKLGKLSMFFLLQLKTIIRTLETLMTLDSENAGTVNESRSHVIVWIMLVIGIISKVSAVRSFSKALCNFKWQLKESMWKYKTEMSLTFLHTAIKMMIKMMAMTTRARTAARTATCENRAEKTDTHIIYQCCVWSHLAINQAYTNSNLNFPIQQFHLWRICIIELKSGQTVCKFEHYILTSKKIANNNNKP